MALVGIRAHLQSWTLSNENNYEEWKFTSAKKRLPISDSFLEKHFGKLLLVYWAHSPLVLCYWGLVSHKTYLISNEFILEKRII